MKTVQKLTTFEDLKSSEKKAEPSLSSLQKHDDLKTLMAEIRNSKAEPKPDGESKK